jgi:hypothetical protein
MRVIFILIFIVSVLKLNGQQLKNTEWVRLLIEKDVGGKMITNQMLGQESVKYLFKENTVLISSNDKYSFEMQYSLDDQTLAIGNFLKYKVDSLTDEILLVHEFPKRDVADSKSSTYTFLNTNYLFDYLKQTQQLPVVNDSVIVANNLLSPAYEGNIDSLFSSGLSDIKSDIIFNGTFTISKDGGIVDVQIPINKKASKKDAEKIAAILKSSGGNWIIPPTPKTFYYRINFSLSISHHDPLVGVNIIFHPLGK